MKKIFLLLSVSILFCSAIFSQKFNVSYTTGASGDNFSGKVLLYLSKEYKNPKDQMVGVERFPCYSLSVKNIKSGGKIVFDDAAISYPVALSDIERGEYYVQAVWDRNLGGRAISNSPGNMYNKPVKVKIGKSREQVYSLVCNEVVKESSFTETQFIKELKHPSSLLTEFYKRPTTIDAAILLPKEYFDEPQRKFPVLYWVSGYGGDYHSFSASEQKSLPMDSTPCIRVFLDGNCSLGHSVYANSDNNGPWGDALVNEMIPAIESKYRCDGGRLLMGHSSGGWTVLWLQTQYPKTFAGCWSSSPDPVDFRSFQQIDIYKDKNMFYGKDSALRMAGTIAGRYPWIPMKTMCSMENVIYRGEQMHSFDAVFGPKKSDGSPARLYQFPSGDIDTAIASYWKKYDISLNVKNNWNSLKEDLDGKAYVSVGNQDNFLLNHAVHLLEDEMKKINANFVFAYYPGDHFTLMTPEYRAKGYKFLQERYYAFKGK